MKMHQLSGWHPVGKFPEIELSVISSDRVVGWYQLPPNGDFMIRTEEVVYAWILLWALDGFLWV